MAQFSVYRNGDPATRKRVPLLLDIQSGLLSALGTRVVVPLYPLAAMKGRIVRTLMPTLVVEGQEYVAVMSELAGVPQKILGAAIANLSAQRGEIVAALDLLITGV